MDPLLHSPYRKYFQGSSNKPPHFWVPWCWWTRQPVSQLGARGQPGAPASPSHLPSPLPTPIFPTLPFPPKKFAGSMKSVSFSFTQENQNKRWKMQHLFCLLISLAPLELFGLILILLNRGLSHRETLMGGKGIKLLLMLKKQTKSKRCSWLRPVL